MFLTLINNPESKFTSYCNSYMLLISSEITNFLENVVISVFLSHICKSAMSCNWISWNENFANNESNWLWPLGPVKYKLLNKKHNISCAVCSTNFCMFNIQFFDLCCATKATHVGMMASTCTLTPIKTTENIFLTLNCTNRQLISKNLPMFRLFSSVTHYRWMNQQGLPAAHWKRKTSRRRRSTPTPSKLPPALVPAQRWPQQASWHP